MNKYLYFLNCTPKIRQKYFWEYSFLLNIQMKLLHKYNKRNNNKLFYI